MNQYKPGRVRHRHHRGAAMFVVIVIIAVSMLVIGTAVSSVAIEHRQSRLRHTARQCRLIANAALDRAATQVAANPSYEGETWIIPATEVATAKDWKVVINVDISNSEDNVLRAVATYPAEGPPQVSKTLQRSRSNPWRKFIEFIQ